MSAKMPEEARCNKVKVMGTRTHPKLKLKIQGYSACANYLSRAAFPSAALSFVAAGRICCICNSSREGRYLMQSWDYSL